MTEPPLKILHVSEMYPPGYGGGAAAYVVDICRLLAERGHSVAVVCAESVSAEPYTVRRTQDGAIPVFRINLPYFVDHDPEGWRLGVVRWRTHQRKLRSVIDSLVAVWRPDLVQCHLPRPLGEDFVVDMKARAIPVVWMLHDAWSICMRMQLIRSPTATLCSGPGLGRCFACMYSNFDGSLVAVIKGPWRLLRHGLLPAYRTWRRYRMRACVGGAVGYSVYMTEAHRPYLPTAHIPLGINLDRLPRERPVRPRVPLRFGFVAGFQPHKGLPDLLDAAALLMREGLRFGLDVWGPGLEGRATEISSRGLDGCVRLQGVFEAEGRWPVYASMDVAVMATTWAEPYGRVVGEAAAMGVPTIAPAVGGLAEQIQHDKSGLLFRFRDRADLCRQMRRVLTETGLYERLVAGLPVVRGTREAILDLETYYYGLLGSTSERDSSGD